MHACAFRGDCHHTAVRQLSGGQEINAVQRRNDLAAHQQFLQSGASLKFLLLRQTLPKGGRLLLAVVERKIGVQFHAFHLAADVPIPFTGRIILSLWEVLPCVTQRKGGQRDSNPQQPEPQSGALPLSYGHRRAATLIFSRPIAKAKQQSGPRRPLQALGASAILRRLWDE